jgi:PAS domain S-box-containing protein
MVEFFRKILGTDFAPHVYCLREPAVVWLHASSDAAIAVAYFAIPLTLLALVRKRRDMEFRWLFLLFGAFVLACGLSHGFAVWTLWDPVYRLEGVVKAITALLSVSTAVVMIRMIPTAMMLPSPQQLRVEIDARRSAEHEARELAADLERRVVERSAELEKSKLDLDANAARLSELTAALDMAQLIVRRFDGEILFWSRGAADFYGWSKEEAVGRISHHLLQTEFPVFQTSIERDLSANGSWAGELKRRRRNGTPVWVASYWVMIRGRNGAPDSIVDISTDISALKATEEALRASESRARALFESASQGILTASPAGYIITANAMIEKLFGYSREELLGQRVEMLLPDRLRHSHTAHHAEYAGHPSTRPMGLGQELQARRKDGSEFPVEISLSFVQDGRTGTAVAFISDISLREQSEREVAAMVRRLESALAEKTVLLQEVHHRVKNNLAVIGSLLAMQADAIGDSDASRSLMDSKQRVHSMALIHEHLYGTDNLKRVRIDEYAEKLTSELYISYSPGASVAVHAEAEPLELSIEQAIPCGLILNELVSNALKYAFPDHRSGKVVVKITRLVPGFISVSVRDDGAGLPADFDWQNATSLGLKIVQILTRQLGGTIELVRERGTEFRFSFPFEEQSPPAGPDTHVRGEPIPMAS